MVDEGIGTWISRRRERSRGDIAIAYRDHRVTYDGLATRIEKLAHSLATLGVSAGDRVAYLGNNHPSFLETFFATATLGAIFVPLNTRLAAPEIEFALTDSGATTLIYHHDLASLAENGSEATKVNLRLQVDGTPSAGAQNFEDVLAAGEPVPVARDVALDDPAMILYTSGTSGKPKGAVISHGNFTWNSFNALVDYEVSSGERVLLISPMFHVAALSMGALPVLLQGGTVILHEQFDPGAVLSTIESEHVTMLSGVPTTFQMLQEHEDWATTDISSLQHLTCGGSSMPERMLTAYEERGLAFSCGYGMTETSPGATALPPRASKLKMGSSGLTHFFTNVKIVDDAGKEVPAGTVGEIWVSGPNVISEYWNRPEATAETFVDGWFRSGDLGYFDEEGYIYISDRLKDMIISGGENIYSAEVETVIMEIPEIAAVALIGLPDERWGEVPMAVVQLKPGATLDAEAIPAYLSGRLAKYKIPKKVVFVEDMPRTASGKIRKTDLRARYVPETAGS